MSQASLFTISTATYPNCKFQTCKLVREFDQLEVNEWSVYWDTTDTANGVPLTTKIKTDLVRPKDLWKYDCRIASDTSIQFFSSPFEIQIKGDCNYLYPYYSVSTPVSEIDVVFPLITSGTTSFLLANNETFVYKTSDNAILRKSINEAFVYPSVPGLGTNTCGFDEYHLCKDSSCSSVYKSANGDIIFVDNDPTNIATVTLNHNPIPTKGNNF
jgi:hypothetical protein